MRIEIINKDGDLITDFELETNPFKVGEKININVQNYDKKFWNISEFAEQFVVDDIEHCLRKDYLPKYTKVNTVFTVSVKVSSC
jgi:hypothetical protein